MAATTSRTDVANPNSGNYVYRFYAYKPAQGVNDRGGVVRNPAGMGFRQGVKPTVDPAWIDRGSVNPYSERLMSSAGTPVESVRFLVETNFSRVRKYVAGMFLFFPGTGDGMYVDGVENVLYKGQKVQLSCTKVS